jgi:hypothetical protein
MGLENKVAWVVTGKKDRLTMQDCDGKKRGSEGDSIPPIKIAASGGICAFFGRGFSREGWFEKW